MSCRPLYRNRTIETNNKHKQFLSNHQSMIFDAVLLGDSIFERFLYKEEAKKAFGKYFFQRYDIFNCSVGGDKIENLLWRLAKGDILSHFGPDPRQIIILIGKDHLRWSPPDERSSFGINNMHYNRINIDTMVDGYQQILDIIRERFPRVRIDVIGVYPMNVDENQPLINNFNARINALTRDYDCIRYHDFHDDLCNNDGSLKTEHYIDHVHFSSSGYDIFARRLVELIEANMPRIVLRPANDNNDN